MNRTKKRRHKKLGGGKQGLSEPTALAPQHQAALQKTLNEAVTLHGAGNLSAAEKLYKNALQIDPNHPVALHLLGLVAHQVGQNDQAVEWMQQALAIKPDYAEAHSNLSLVFQALGRPKDAVGCCRTALRLVPEYAEAHCNLGNALRTLGKRNQAADCYRKAIAINPNFAMAHFNLGLIFKDLMKTDQAVSSFEKAIALQPNFAEAHNNLGMALKAQHLFELAVDSYQIALTLNPNYAEALVNLGCVLNELNRFTEAEDCSRKAILIKPTLAEGHLNLGGSLLKQMRNEEAMISLHQVLVLEPENADAFCCLGLAHLGLGQLEIAEENFRIALKLQPDLVIANNNLYILQLLRCDFKNGFANSKLRFDHLNQSNLVKFNKPRWTGEDLTGKCLALFSEQGIGDEILYSTMFNDLKHRAGRLIVECDPRLMPVYERSFKDITFISKVRPQDKALGCTEVDFQLDIGSLGQYLRSDIADFPVPTAFLKASPKGPENLRNRYKNWSKGRPIIGISWRSGSYGLSTQKSISLAQWLPILSNPDVAFLNLQYGNVEDELRLLKKQTDIDIFCDPGIDPLKDMDAFVDQVAAVDMVISISNATVHVAGALGQKTWLMLPLVSPIWCWHMDRDDSLWYPNIRVFRQPAFGDWDSVIDTVGKNLQTVDFP